MTLGSITSNTSCHLYEFCTGVRCCTEVPILGRSINSWLMLDHCNYKLSVGFEKFSVNVSLSTYTFGEEQLLDVNGVLRLRYIYPFIYSSNINIIKCCHIVYVYNFKTRLYNLKKMVYAVRDFFFQIYHRRPS